METIISLTSTVTRLNVARYTLLSLLHQTRPPDRIILNLSREAYLLDDGVDELPIWLEDLQASHPLEVRWTKNTGPYRKLHPAIADCSDDDIIITCDDDAIYGEKWLEHLLRAATRQPDAIICGRACTPVRNIVGRLQSYVHWPLVTINSAGLNLIPIGVAGVVYRKRLLDCDFLFWEEFLRSAPGQDDFWFKKASERRGTPVHVVPVADEHVHPIRVGAALSDTNASAQLKRDWASLFPAIAERATFRLKAYVGFSVCVNDVAWRAVERASREFQGKH